MFDGNSIRHDSNSSYPWKRRGSTCDWVAVGKEYALSKFLAKDKSDVEVSCAVITDEVTGMLKNDFWPTTLRLNFRIPHETRTKEDNA